VPVYPIPFQIPCRGKRFQPASYSVWLEIATEGQPSQLELEAGNSKLQLELPETGGLDTYQTINAGELVLSSKGEQQLTLRPGKSFIAFR